jgi:lipid A 4'-phosphatase
MTLIKQYADIILFLVLSIIFFTLPQIDLWVAGLFYEPGAGFIYSDNVIVHGIYLLFAKIQIPIVILILLGIGASYIKKYHKQHWRKPAVFMFVVLLLGPGLLVNEVFKNHWDRARPKQIERFGDTKEFSPAYVISDQCERNCSFVSRHGAIAFYFMILAWPLRKRRWLALGIAVGAIVGGGRIIQGGHFFSDVVLAGYSVYFVARLFSYLILGHSTIKPVENTIKTSEV